MPSRTKPVKLIQLRLLVLLHGPHLAFDRQRSRFTLARMVMDRALAARDARRMWIAISARASLCDHARARGPYSALIEPRTENTEKIAPKQKKHRSQTREQSGRARR